MFSIFIPTINNLPYLQLAISYIERHTVLPYEILIYDNGSDQETAEYIANLPHKSIRSERNVGVCKAYNQLAVIANGNYFLLWDDDKLILPGWDANIFPMLEQDGRYIWKSLVEIWPYDTNPCSIQRNYGTTVAAFDEEGLLRDAASVEFPRMVSLSASQLMSRELYEAIGGYDEKFFPGFGSDPDVAWRAFCFLDRNPKQFLNANKSFYYHFTSSTTNRIFPGSISNKGLRLWGRVLFGVKHGFLPQSFRARVSHGCRDVL